MKAAHIGVGIIGKEGMQAVNNSDYLCRRGKASGVTDFHKPKPLDGLKFDHCFENWRGSARIDHADGRGSLRIHCPQSPRHCVVFVPENETYFCFEPVSHLTGAFEMDPGAASGLVSLKPGERLDFSMQIELANPAH